MHHDDPLVGPKEVACQILVSESSSSRVDRIPRVFYNYGSLTVHRRQGQF
jgi:hypothetical protein